MGIALNFEAEVLKVAVGVRITICEVDFIVFIDEIIVPGQGKIGFILHTALAIAILIVLYILSPSVPADIFLLGLPLRVYDNFHPHFV